MQKGYASDAKIQIKNIVMGADLMKQETGKYPQTTDDMETAGYLDLKPSVKLKWDGCLSNLKQSITK